MPSSQHGILMFGAVHRIERLGERLVVGVQVCTVRNEGQTDLNLDWRASKVLRSRVELGGGFITQAHTRTQTQAK